MRQKKCNPLPVWFFLVLLPSRSNGQCGAGSHVKRGEKSDVCVVIAKRLDWRPSDQQYVRSAFQVEADKFAQIRWPEISDQNHTDLIVSVQAGDHASYQKYFRTTKNGNIILFPILSAVIKVHQGDIRQILWDDVCFDTDDGCIDNSYDYTGSEVDDKSDHTGLKQSYLYFPDSCSSSSSKLCQLRIFISWIGTDANGDVFLSQQFRFSRFDSDLIDTYVKNDDL